MTEREFSIIRNDLGDDPMGEADEPTGCNLSWGNFLMGLFESVEDAQTFASHVADVAREYPQRYSG